MNLELSDEQAAALEKELAAIIEGDRYFLSPRIQMLLEIRNTDPPRIAGAFGSRTFQSPAIYW
jgi:hypothetical protein